MESCSSCNAGHFLDSSLCPSNVCSCSNGVGATGTNCPSNGAALCTSCNDDFELENGSCEEVSQGVPGLCVSNCPDDSLIQLCADTVPTDVVFVVDGSSSVGQDDFDRSIDFLGNVCSAMDISPTTTRVALVQYSR